MIRPIRLIAFMLCGLLQAACMQHDLVRHASVAPQAAKDSSDSRTLLAGEWEYEDSDVVYSLILDEQGNGRYAWKDGRFVTTNLSGHSWRGTWSQRENDREGEFEVQLSSDYSGGEGRWWYTRIEGDVQPRQAGGTFRLTRITVTPRPIRDAEIY